MLIEVTFYTPEGDACTPVLGHWENAGVALDELGDWTVTRNANGSCFLFNPLDVVSAGGLKNAIAMMQRDGTALAHLNGELAAIARPANTLS